jgi:putative IMPACT (imprinted ancient) family translation regulator
LTTLRKTPLTAYTLQCEYGQLAGVEALLAQFCFAEKAATSAWGSATRSRTDARYSLSTTFPENWAAYGGGVHQALAQLTTLRKTPLTAYTLQCEYGQLAGVVNGVLRSVVNCASA